MPKIITSVIAGLWCLAVSTIVFAQSGNQQQALEKGRQAIKLEDEGKYDEAIKLLEEAQKLDPDMLDYPYELAYSYYAKEDYKKAISYLEPLTKHPHTIARVFQTLGNAYDILGQGEKAAETYDAGLKIFPKSGGLFLEKGNLYWAKKDYNSALKFYEQGIRAEPSFPSNYYRASRIYCASTEAAWGIIYGEVFMNLERNTKRTAEISKLLYDTYKSHITFKSSDTVLVSFSSDKLVVNSNKMKNIKDIFPLGTVYELTLSTAVAGEKSITINSLDAIRSRFIDIYYQKSYNKDYPNALFDYQKKVKEAGFLEEYNHWILMQGGDEAEFSKWQLADQSGWNNFVKWFSVNSLKLDERNHGYRE